CHSRPHACSSAAVAGSAFTVLGARTDSGACGFPAGRLSGASGGCGTPGDETFPAPGQPAATDTTTGLSGRRHAAHATAVSVPAARRFSPPVEAWLSCRLDRFAEPR